ncbi:MAG: TetR/AcrR family transcriptional regulator C-terminal domain-containing protein [Actinobacteria bacterium]|nr:TetR/AcrR family transcriptional regulator C-terminal domain-containing protein [Actinomycetota bacterium]
MSSPTTPPGPPRRPSRGRPPKGGMTLSPETIADTALREIDAHGVNGLSIRAVARRLAVDHKSLYNHVDGKDGLLDAVAGRILSTIALPAPTGDLDADIRAFAHAFRAHALRHPQAAALVLTRPVTSPSGLVPIDAALAVLMTAGFSPAQAVHVLRLLMALLVGAILREADSALTLATGDHDEAARRAAQLSTLGLPALSAAAAHISMIDDEAEFDFTVAAALEAIRTIPRS